MKQSCFFCLIVVCFLFTASGCSAGKPAAHISDSTFTPSVTMTNTIESQTTPPPVTTTSIIVSQTNLPPEMTATDTVAPKTTATDTATPKPTNSLETTNTAVFIEQFPSTPDPYGRYNVFCAQTFIKNYSQGYYYFKIREQPENLGYCVLSPVFIKVPQGIEKINIELSYDSVNSDEETYVGFYYTCGAAKIGVWIDDYFVYYQNELEKLTANKMRVIGEIPHTETGHHVISVFWGNQIQVFVDNVQMTGNEYVLQSCTTLPKDFFYGIKAEPGKNMDAFIYNFEIFGKAP